MSGTVRVVDFGYPQKKAASRHELAAQLRILADEIEANENSEVCTLLILGLDEGNTVPAKISRVISSHEFTRAEYVFALTGEIHHVFDPKDA